MWVERSLLVRAEVLRVTASLTFVFSCFRFSVVRAMSPDNLAEVKRWDERVLMAGNDMAGSGSRESLTRRSTNSCWVNLHEARARPAPSREKKESATSSPEERAGSILVERAGFWGGGVRCVELGCVAGDDLIGELGLSRLVESRDDNRRESIGCFVDCPGKGSMGCGAVGFDSG